MTETINMTDATALTPLKTIVEHNAERRRIHEERNKPRPTGVKCPECGAELLQHPADWLLGSYTRADPQRKTVWCPHCELRTTILA